MLFAAAFASIVYMISLLYRASHRRAIDDISMSAISFTWLRQFHGSDADAGLIGALAVYYAFSRWSHFISFY